jgi:hypothetical protein
MNSSKITGTLVRELSLRKDKNGNDYYMGKLACHDGFQKVFFFFQPDYSLIMRLVELKPQQEITLLGYGGKNPTTFIASGLYVEEREDSVFSFENQEKEIF